MAILFGNEINRLNKDVSIETVAGFALPTVIFTAPATHKVVITAVELRCSAASGITGEATIRITTPSGIVFASQQLTGVTAVDDTWTFASEGRGVVIPASAAVSVLFDNAATGTSQTLLADVLGYLVT